jgi:hypothetical protein
MNLNIKLGNRPIGHRLLMASALLFCIFFGVYRSAADGGQSGTLALPFKDNFRSSLDPEWQTNVSSGATLTLKDGGIVFDAPTGARADIRRPSGIDNITFSGKIVQWGSVYLVWNAKNWCGVGQISPTPFGQLYSTMVTNDAYAETDYRGIDFYAARWVRIQLGANYIRFLYSKDGTDWTTLRTFDRPAELAGAPSLIAAGRYYDKDDKPFADEPATQAAGEKIGGRILALRVKLTPQDKLNLTDAELDKIRKPYVEPVGALLSESKDDPTFEQVASYYPAMKYPREIVGVPRHPLAIGVDWSGRLDVSPWTDPVGWFEIGNPPTPLGQAGTVFTRRLLHGYLPIETLATARDGIEYKMTVFGWSDEFNVDRPLFAYVRITATASNDVTLPREVALVSPDKKRRVWQMTSDSSNEAHISLSFEFPKPDSARPVTTEEFDSKLNDCAARWEKQLAPADRFDVPDAQVMEAYRAWLTYSMLNTKTIGGYVEPDDGSGFYDSMFGISVSTYTRALDYYGYHDYAAEILGMQMHFQQADGLYSQDCGLGDPGSLLEALAEHYRMTGDREWLRRISPHIISQCEWLIRQRQAAPKAGLVRGLIKFRPYNDYREPVYNYLGNAWCAEGMKEAALALQDIGLPEGRKYAAEAESYRRDILDSMNAAAFEDNGQTLLPLEPDTHRLLKLTRNRGGSYYGLSASSLLETDFLPPYDKRTTWIVDMLEKRGGLNAGLCEFEDGMDHAYTYGYLMTEMKRDEDRKVILGFWSMMAYGMTRGTYSPVEVTMFKEGDNSYTLPHTYSLSEQLRLLRNLLVREDGDVLWVGQGIPREWLAPGKHVAVSAAPTEFGDFSYRIDAQATGQLRVSITPPSRHSPREIRLRLRDPQDRPIVSVETLPPVNVHFTDETVVLPNLQIPVDLTVSFKDGQ